jgi:hypothetical protein
VQYHAYGAGLYVFTHVLLFYGIIAAAILFLASALFGKQK